MKFVNIKDVKFSDITKSNYDHAIFCSGYEERGTFVPRKLEGEELRHKTVFGFDESREEWFRPENDTYYLSQWTDEIEIVSGNDDQGIYNLLHKKSPPQKKHLKLLVDYTAMSRVWYSAIINWCRFVEGFKSIQIDFLYSVGSYINNPEPMVIKEVSSLPGFDGNPLGRNNSLVIFGLGFEGLATMCVLEMIEPDKVYSFLSNPASADGVLERIRKENIDITNISSVNLELPLDQVSVVVKALSELVRPHLNSFRITLAPMGAKPHVLATLFLGTLFPEITCLRVSGRAEKKENVSANGNLIITRAEFVE